MNTAAANDSSMPCIISSGRGNPRTIRTSSGSLSMSTLWPLPCESQTTMSAGPVSRMPAMAAFTSPVIHSRARWYSNPSGPSCAGWTTPEMPSMSTEMKTLRGRCAWALTTATASGDKEGKSGRAWQAHSNRPSTGGTCDVGFWVQGAGYWVRA